MLHIILFILKIIGWILLAVLGVVVLLACVVIFTPLRYEILGKCEGDLPSLNLNIRFTFFLHLVSGTVQYANEQLHWKLRIAWKNLGSEAEEGETETPEADASTTIEVNEAEAETAEYADDKSVEESTEDNTEIRTKTTEEKTQDIKMIKEKAPETKVIEEKRAEAKSVKETTAKASERERGRDKDKPNTSFLDKADSFLEKTAYKFEQLCDKIKELIRKKELVMDFLTNEFHKAAFRKAINELKRLLMRLKPKKLNGTIEFGFEDPSLTGKVLAGASVLYPYFADYIQVTPNFEEKILKGDCYIKGNVAARCFVSLGLRLLLDKNIRITIRHAKKFKLD